MGGATVYFWISAFIKPVKWSLPSQTMFSPLTHANILRELSDTEAPMVQYYHRAALCWVDVKEEDMFELSEGSVLLLRSGQTITFDLDGIEIALDYLDLAAVLNRYAKGLLSTKI
ncbi:hypothetical protein CALCODRAFT_487367 [Calocera cornea HHB12733]|uniref:Uncharacterized protein n=1 Tax=Calocera cornea HHB12733 TaxID=1353952 RepID=A0A165D5J1_9BASI|nr:hypothetical protein CALCODRAFT_487367 [Calocera cornea HHB12733]